MNKVTTDTTLLEKTNGYWSGRDIYINNSKYLVVLKPDITPDELVGIITEYIDGRLYDLVKNSTHKGILYILKSVQNNPIWRRGNTSSFFRYGINFSGITPPMKPPWSQFYRRDSAAIASMVAVLLQNGIPPKQISEDMTQAWMSVHRYKPYNGLYVQMVPIEGTLLSVPWEKCRYSQTITMLDDMWKLVNLDISPGRFGLTGKYNHSRPHASQGAIILNDLTAEENRLFSRFGGQTCNSFAPSQLKIYMNAVVSAVTQALLLLVKSDVCLIPFSLSTSAHCNAIGFTASVYGQNFCSGHYNHRFSSYASGLLGCTSMKSLKDFPVNLAKYKDIEQNTALAATFSKPLKEFALKHNLKEYPYRDLKRRATSEYRMFSPEWAKDKLTKEWADIVAAFWMSSDAGDGQKISCIAGFCPWACDIRGFNTPYEIKPKDIKNPFMDKDELTFFKYLSNLDISEDSKTKRWLAAAKFFSLTANSSKLPGSPVFGSNLQNPFEGCANPFKKEQSGFKSQRPRMPQSLVELMIETLLDPDENGVFTYRWVEDATAVSDTVLVRNPDDPSEVIQVWCPSTANCLANILLTPIRGHQSRWLDQGLLDEFIFDIQTQTMVKNTHPLAQWRYKNGNTQMQQYGRLSGVFQNEYDPLIAADEFIIWVSTNKTQMWDPAQKRGHPLPWPTGEELMKSDDEAVRTAGTCLNRAYQVLTQQVIWMQRYDPNPYPVSFQHDPRDRRKINNDPAYIGQYPWFAPIFRNLADPFKDERDGQIVNIHIPVSWAKMDRLFGLLALETERRLKVKTGRNFSLTRVTASGIKCKYRPHDLRLAGISYLLEMGVPIHVVQYLVGHATVLMTFGYAKFRTPWIKEQILSAIKRNVHDVDGFDRAFQLVKDGRISPEVLLVFPKRNGDTQFGAIAEDLTAYVPMVGGLCRMGGFGSGSCQVGRLITRVSESGSNVGEEVEEYGDTGGHCALCRFWATGPLFLQEQEYVGNLTTFRLRELCRRRKKFYDRRNELAIAIDSSPVGISKQQLELDRLRINDEINNASTEITTLQLDFGIRAELFEESEKRMSVLRRILEENPDAAADHFELVTGQIGDQHDFKAEIVETCELGLVRSIIERFRFIERKVVAVPGDVAMRGAEITDQLLEAIDFHGGRLFQIRDHEDRAAAASMLMNFFSYAADPVKGDSILQGVIDGKSSLDMLKTKKEKLQQLATLVIGTAKTEGAIDWENMAREGSAFFGPLETPSCQQLIGSEC
ncbi:MAG: tyrosine-type recombinase/integrase [Geobacteraceae bacterium]|nr:tyrosine-type recombinase/integrase [Geobacteraceae bacterium]